MLPEGWLRAEIGEVADVLTGYPFPSAAYVDGTPGAVRLLRGDNVAQGYLRWEDAKFWPATHEERIKEYELRRDDIVLALDRPIVGSGLKCSVVRIQDLPCLLVQRVARIRARGQLDQGYLAQLMQTHAFKQHLRGSKTETAVPHVSPNDVKSFFLMFPKKAEQIRIAGVLRTWDEATGIAQKLLLNAREQCRGLMQQLLDGERRMRVDKECRLGQLFTERSETGQTDLPLLSVTREQGLIWRDDVGRKDTSSEDKSKYLRVCPGDIVYNTMRMWQGVSALSKYEGLVSPAYTVITPREGVSARFMAYFFKHPRIIHDFYRYSQGLVSDTWNLKYQQFSQIRVRVPDFTEQERIANIIDVAHSSVRSLERSNELLVQQKYALMQQILTGKRRVKLDSGAVSELEPQS